MSVNSRDGVGAFFIMTNEQRRTYSDTYIKQTDRLSRKFIKPVYLALKSQVDQFITDMNTNGLQRASSRLHVVVQNDEITPVLRQLHLTTGLFFGRKAWREINRSVKTKAFGFNDKWIQDLINFFKTDLFQTVSAITSTTKQLILSVLTQALNEGWSNDQIVSKLESPDLLAWRARRIVRTEIAKASAAGRNLAQTDTEWETQKEWISANDHRVRHSHRIVDGDMIDAGAKFKVENPDGGIDLMDGPGDPFASAANIINCRCSSAVVVKRDENGRLIPKQTKPGLPATINVFTLKDTSYAKKSA